MHAKKWQRCGELSEEKQAANRNAKGFYGFEKELRQQDRTSARRRSFTDGAETYKRDCTDSCWKTIPTFSISLSLLNHLPSFQSPSQPGDNLHQTTQPNICSSTSSSWLPQWVLRLPMALGDDHTQRNSHSQSVERSSCTANVNRTSTGLSRSFSLVAKWVL